MASPLRIRFFCLFILPLTLVSNAGGLPINQIQLPDGFSISVVTDQVKNARQIAMSPVGTIFVGSRNQAKKVYAISDNNKDWQADSVEIIADRLQIPSGVAYFQGDLYVAANNRLLKFRDIDADKKDRPAMQVVSRKLPRKKYHGWRYIKFGPDGKLYLPIGIPCDACSKKPPYGQMLSMVTDTAKLNVVARGLRSVQGLAWHPQSGELWFSDNGRNHLGDDIPPDEVNRISQPNMHFGAPFCHGGDIPDPDLGGAATCEGYDPPTVKLPAHVSPLGIQFYRGDNFPAEFRNCLLIAEHGSWDRSEPQGYRISMVTLDQDGVVTDYAVFAEGWLNPDGSYWGRPTDLFVAPDGSLLVSDDHAGAIYRISYH